MFTGLANAAVGVRLAKRSRRAARSVFLVEKNVAEVDELLAGVLPNEGQRPRPILDQGEVGDA